MMGLTRFRRPDRTNMNATIRGFKVVINANGHRDVLFVPFTGIETEEQAIASACGVARNGYPIGTIDCVSVESGTWCPTGSPADEAGSILWVD